MTFCLALCFRAEGYEDVFGYFVRITEDRRKAEVYVPTLDDVIFPPRKAVLPLKDDAPCRALEASFNRKEANQVGNSNLTYWIRQTLAY